MTTPPRRIWWSVRQVADILGLSPTTIRRHIWDGKIPARQSADGHPWKIPGWYVEKEMDKVREPIARPRRRFVTLPPTGG